MKSRNNIISISSTLKAINKARVTGKLEMKIISSYNLINYLISFIDSTIENGSTLYIETKKDLLLLLSELVYKNPDIICNYKTTVINNPDTYNSKAINLAPSIKGITIDMIDEETYTFKVSDITESFFDKNGDWWKYVIIYPEESEGIIKYKGVIKSSVFTIKVEDIVYVTLTRAYTDTAYNDSFVFRVSDNNINILYSSLTTNSIIGNAITSTTNQPPTVGDNTIYTENRVTTVLTLEMFTSLLQPPYNDPEGDLIDAIRMDEISTANQGVFYLNGVPISVGTIITRESLSNNEFIHIAPNSDAITSDVFSFSARDEGSLIWVQ